MSEEIFVSRHTLHSVIAIAITVTLGDAHAQPPAVGVFCQKYPNSPQCLGQQPSCTFCHIAPPQRNVFGSAIEMNRPFVHLNGKHTHL